ncbi:MAG: hypothetical protein ACRDFS_10965 [Chloroflexota bacterium]
MTLLKVIAPLAMVLACLVAPAYQPSSQAREHGQWALQESGLPATWPGRLATAIPVKLTRESSATTADLNVVACPGADLCYVVGDHGSVLAQAR